MDLEEMKLQVVLNLDSYICIVKGFWMLSKRFYSKGYTDSKYGV